MRVGYRFRDLYTLAQAPINAAMGRRVLALLSAALLANCASTGAVRGPPLPAGSGGARTPPGTDTGAPDRLASPNPRSGSPKSGTRAADGYSISSTALSLRGAPPGTGAPTLRASMQWFCEYVFRNWRAGPSRHTQPVGLGHEVDPLRSNRGIWCSSQLPHRVRRTSGFRWVAISSSTHRAAAECTRGKSERADHDEPLRRCTPPELVVCLG